MNTIKSGNLAARCSFARIKSHDKSGDQKQSNFVADFFFGTADSFIDKICSSGSQSETGSHFCFSPFARR